MRKTIPRARRALGEGHRITLKMRKIYAKALYNDTSATLHDIQKAVTTLEDVERTARRVFGDAHPTVVDIGQALQVMRTGISTGERVSTT